MDNKFYDSILNERDEALFKQRIISIENDITTDEVTRLKRLLHALDLKSHDTITIQFDSQGGQIDPVIEALHYLEDNIRAPLRGYVSGRCASAALTLLQGCQRREATRHSWFLIHSVALNPKVLESCQFRLNEYLPKKLQLIRQYAELNQREMEQILSKRTGHRVTEVRRWLKRGDEFGEYFRAVQAKRMGLIDRVI